MTTWGQNTYSCLPAGSQWKAWQWQWLLCMCSANNVLTAAALFSHILCAHEELENLKYHIWSSTKWHQKVCIWSWIMGHVEDSSEGGVFTELTREVRLMNYLTPTTHMHCNTHPQVLLAYKSYCNEPVLLGRSKAIGLQRTQKTTAAGRRTGISPFCVHYSLGGTNRSL